MFINMDMAPSILGMPTCSIVAFNCEPWDFQSRFHKPLTVTSWKKLDAPKQRTGEAWYSFVRLRGFVRNCSYLLSVFYGEEAQ